MFDLNFLNIALTASSIPAGNEALSETLRSDVNLLSGREIGRNSALETELRTVPSCRSSGKRISRV